MRSRVARPMKLFRWRSTTALVSCLTGAALAVGAIVGGMLLYAVDGVRPTDLLRYFTTISNLFSAASATLLVPFVVEGHRMGYFTCPKWVAMLYYSATICTTITWIVAVLLISRVDPHAAFGGYNLFLHVLCPPVMLIAFLLVASEVAYSVTDAIVCSIPVFTYGIYYYVMVVFIGADNGGWDDMYYVLDFVYPPLALAIVIAGAIGVSLLIRLACKKLSAYRKQELFRAFDAAQSTPDGVLARACAMGRYEGRHVDKSHMVVPVNVIDMVVEYYGIDRSTVADAYLRGMLEGLEEREARARQGDIWPSRGDSAK